MFAQMARHQFDGFTGADQQHGHAGERFKICRARVQAAKATETALAPISVSVRTRLATENDFWNIRSSSLTFR
jgi:hypothetical protein